MPDNSGKEYTFRNLRYGMEVGDRSKISRIIPVEVCLLYLMRFYRWRENSGVERKRCKL